MSAELPPPSRPVSAEVSGSRITTGGPRYSVFDHETNTVTLVSSRSVTVPMQSDERKFRALAEQWYLDTLLTSSYFEKILHPSYQRILTLGETAIPLILAELKDMPNDWFWALRVLSDADPVEDRQAGDMQAMADAWIAWGREKGYI